MTPKQRWKTLWRELRIIRREVAKAQLDMLVFGTGVVAYDASGARHVPWRGVQR